MLNLIKEKRKVVLIIGVITIILIIALPFFFCKGIPLFNATASKFERAELIAQILAALFVAVGTFVAVFQYYFSSRSQIIQYETDKIDKAIKLAEFYKDEILCPYTVLKAVYRDVGIIDILQPKYNDFVNFDFEEMKELLGEQGIDKIEKIKTSKEYCGQIATLNEMMGFGINGSFSESTIDESGKSRQSIRVDIDKIRYDFAIKYTCKILNNMEIFAMNFSHNVADKSVIYRSVYPTYIEICRVLYYDIAICCKDGQPQLYRNVQWLYSKWNRQMKEEKEKRRQTASSLGGKSENFR